jgi:hypothetical protein
MSDDSVDLVVVFGVIVLVLFRRDLRQKRNRASDVWTRVDQPLKFSASATETFEATQFRQAQYPLCLISLTKSSHIRPPINVNASMPELVDLPRARFKAIIDDERLVQKLGAARNEEVVHICEDHAQQCT